MNKTIANKPKENFIEQWIHILQAHQIPFLYFMKAKTRLVEKVTQACDLFYSIFNSTTQSEQIRIEQFSYFTLF